jgi:hypothetical protein
MCKPDPNPPELLLLNRNSVFVIRQRRSRSRFPPSTAGHRPSSWMAGTKGTVVLTAATGHRLPYLLWLDDCEPFV